jgi:uncharacterized protein with WD repeat
MAWSSIGSSSSECDITVSCVAILPNLPCPSSHKVFRCCCHSLVDGTIAQNRHICDCNCIGRSGHQDMRMQATRCNLCWNAKGSHVLCQSISDFDATNQCYFGESRLYLLSADGRTDMAITMEGDVNIVDVAWSPGGQDFIALGGHQPATAVLFDLKGKTLCKITKGPFNHIRWSPHGRFILLAGFGNLPGDIALFERSGKECTPMGALRSACSVMVEWSPCGRYFLTASVAPRMRVDNRITVFTYCGEQIANQPYDELRAAHWKPLPVVCCCAGLPECTLPGRNSLMPLFPSQPLLQRGFSLGVYACA